MPFQSALRQGHSPRLRGQNGMGEHYAATEVQGPEISPVAEVPERPLIAGNSCHTSVLTATNTAAIPATVVGAPTTSAVERPDPRKGARISAAVPRVALTAMPAVSFAAPWMTVKFSPGAGAGSKTRHPSGYPA